MKKTSNKKVIRKKNKKKASKKQNIFMQIMSFLKSHLKNTLFSIIGVIAVTVLVVFIIHIVNISSLNKIVLTIDDMEYTMSDFNVYFYSVKYDYFGKDANGVTDDNMKIIVDSTENITLGEYLKEQTLREIKTATVIKEYASKNNVELNANDLQQLSKEKKKYIKSIGGRGKFNKFLKDNHTTEKSYDVMAETDKLYTKIISKLYGEGKRKDLTEEELLNAQNNYPNHYFKIEQVILTTIDVKTRKSLSDTEINQKKTLAETINEMAKSGEDFDKLVQKYSENSTDKEPPYYEYYKTGQLLDSIEEAIVKLDNNAISDVIQTDYAFHIIKRLELDDSKYNDYLDELREEKALKDLNASLDSLKVIYRDAYKKIKY